MPVATYVNQIRTALPDHDVHAAFIDWAGGRVATPRARRLFDRMAARAGIDHRWSVLDPAMLAGSDMHPDGVAPFQTTGERMTAYAAAAPPLALAAIAGLGDLSGVTHLVVASCTGFVAPGIDQIVARAAGLSPAVERTLIGFMGCYAGATALRTAHHLVRSQPAARVLVVTVELCTLHLQPDQGVDALLAMLLFGDGAAAAIVSADPVGLEIADPFAAALPDSGDLITWTVGDTGFVMTLSGAVPTHIGRALADPAVRARILGAGPAVDGWAVHAGGRSILDAVETTLALPGDALAHSRDVLRDCGNMSSNTLLFILERILAAGRPVAEGRALAFGPGLAVEGFAWRTAP